MPGYEVRRDQLDQACAEAVLQTREALRKVETVYEFLANNPAVDGVDPLTDPEGHFGYTEDEAYLVRLVIEGLHNLPAENILHTGRKLTGLL